MDTKLCKKCGGTKTIDEFYKNSGQRDGLNTYCKICSSEVCRLWVKNHPEKEKERSKKYRQDNSIKEKERHEKYRQNNPEKIKESSRIYRQNNAERIKEWYRKNSTKVIEKSKRWAKNNPEKARIKNRKWRKANPEKVKETRKKLKEYYKKYYREYAFNKRRTNVRYRLKCNVSRLVTGRLKFRLLSKNGKSTFTFLPYTVDDLIKRLESLFAPWMNWQNYGKQPGYWCIDHIRPDSSFTYKSVHDEEFQKCWALSNLQPLEWLENIKKSDKYEFKLQPDRLRQKFKSV